MFEAAQWIACFYPREPYGGLGRCRSNAAGKKEISDPPGRYAGEEEMTDK